MTDGEAQAFIDKSPSPLPRPPLQDFPWKR